MTQDTSVLSRSRAQASGAGHWRHRAWLVIVLADVGLLAWGAMAALAPDHLLGPGGAPILAAGYEGLTKRSWSTLAATSPGTGEFITVLFRVYGAYGVAFGWLSIAIAATAFRRGERWAWWALLVGNTIAFGGAMIYDRAVDAIGPFEMLEYVGLGGIYAALAIASPSRIARPSR